jgi:hypothetical protein
MAPATKTRPPVLMHCMPTPQAVPTPLAVFKRFMTTRLATTTQPPVSLRLLTTSPAVTTLPSVFARCFSIQSVTATSQLVFQPVSISPLAVTILISATLVLLGSSGRIRIGTQRIQTATFIAGITDVAVTGSQVVVSPNGRLGITASSKRFKDEIKPMDNASEAILALRPVTFRYKHDLHPEGNPQFGLVAEEVEKVNPDLVARDAEGKVFSVRYEAVNAMLLNEFLKEHSKVEKLEATVAKQYKDFEAALAD